MGKIRLKRIYEAPAPDDGLRVLVDGLWPRGLARDDARLDLWLKDVAPSEELRRWFGHDPTKWPEFRARYRQELAAKPEALEKLRGLARQSERLTLLFAARDEARNNAVVLRELLDES